MHPQVVQYIKDARAKKVSDDEIRKDLLGVGWTGTIVEASFAEIAKASTPPQVKEEVKKPIEPKKTEPATEAPKKGIQQITKPSLDTQPVTQNDKQVPGQTFVPQKETQQPSSKFGIVMSVLVAVMLFGGVGYAWYIYGIDGILNMVGMGEDSAQEEVAENTTVSLFSELGAVADQIQDGTYSIAYTVKAVPRTISVPSIRDTFTGDAPLIDAYIQMEDRYANMRLGDTVNIAGTIVNGGVYLSIDDTPNFLGYDEWEGKSIQSHNLAELPQLPAILHALNASNVLLSVGDQKNELVDGVQTMRYVFKLNPVQTPAFYLALRNALSNSTNVEDTGSYIDAFNDYIALLNSSGEVNEFLQVIAEQMKLYVWVDQERMLPVRIVLVGTIAPSDSLFANDDMPVQIQAGVSIRRKDGIDAPKEPIVLDKPLLYFFGFEGE